MAHFSILQMAALGVIAFGLGMWRGWVDRRKHQEKVERQLREGKVWWPQP